MKVLLLCLFVLVGCATKLDKKPVVESKDIEPISFKQKKVRLRALLDSHPEFNKETKVKIENLLIGAIEEGQKLKMRESQLIQQVARYTLVEQGSYSQIKKLKSALKKVYETKYNNISKTIDKLKKIVGIAPVNKSLINDFQKDHILEFR